MNDIEEAKKISLEFKVLINNNDVADVADVISISAYKRFCMPTMERGVYLGE